MHKFLASLITVFFASTMFSFCANATHDWQVLASREMGFLIRYPKSWNITNDGTTNNLFSITAPNFSSCAISKTNETRTMEQFVKFMKEGGLEKYLSRMNKALVIEKKETQWVMQRALLYVYTWILESVGRATSAKTLQIFIIENGIGWVGTCTASPEEFEKDRPIFEAILGSVIIPHNAR